MEISRDHPRYKSLVMREKMSEMMRQGIVAPTGLIAHGRGEAFDYLLGEVTLPPAELAERVAAAMLMEAKRPVITVNGNAAALAPVELIELSKAVNARLEVNLFHRSVERIELVCRHLESQGAKDVLGRVQDFTLPGIASDRALCANEGIGMADIVLIPLEDGDRAEALVKAGKKVIAIDLNPVSRTSMAADVSIVDELTRALPNITSHVGELTGDGGRRCDLISGFNNRRNLGHVLRDISDHLKFELSSKA
ncbi:MAG: 4-phosphopantoate--beta-alanine ligase [Methanomassiliicoccales archaeon]